MNASIVAISTITTIEMPYQWRSSPWLLNVQDDCVKDIAVEIMRQAILDAQEIGKGEGFGIKRKRIPSKKGNVVPRRNLNVVEQEKRAFLDWLYSPHFKRVVEVIGGWSEKTCRDKLEALLN